MEPKNIINNVKKIGINTIGKIDKSPLFETGIMPVVTSILSNTIVILSLVAICLSLGPAKHIIMSDFAYIDPTSTTFLIILYSYLVTSIYYKERYALSDDDQKQISEIFHLMQFIAASFPMIIWFCFLAFNDASSKWSSMTITFAAIILSIKLHYSSKKYINANNAVSAFYIGFGISIIVLLYNVCLYVFNVEWLNNNYLLEQTASGRLVACTIGTIGLLLCIYFYEKITHHRKMWILLSLVLFFSFLFSVKGAINALDVLLVFIIIVRLLLYLFGYFLMLVHDFFKIVGAWASNEVIPANNFVRNFVVTLPFIVFVFILISDKNNDIHAINLTSSTRDTLYMEEYITKWVDERKNTNDPIIIMAGQGGGSRAGCTFFAAMSILDTMEHINNNILAMTTISGSSAGAGFYLATKQIEQDSLQSRHLLHKLFTKDYVSSLLFKLLISDPFIGMLPTSLVKKYKWSGRNSSLLDLESRAIKDALNMTKPNELTILEQGWSKVYHKNEANMPLFLPASYNINYGLKALSSPYPFKEKTGHHFYAILDSLAKSEKEITIGESILLSEMFPLINANALVDSSMYIDGGVYDNYGFESLLDLYDIVSKIRYNVAPKKAILIIPVLNSAVDLKEYKMKYEHPLMNTINAASKTIFTSYPNQNLTLLSSKMERNGDHLRTLDVFPAIAKPIGKEENEKPKKSFFRYQPDSTKIMMSRYLHWKEIDKLVSIAHIEIDTKIKNQKFRKTQHEIFFDFRNSKMEREAELLLNNISDDCMDMCVSISGYTDNRGNPDSNKKLATDRAKSVRTYLEAKLKNKISGISISTGQYTQYRENIFDRIYDRKCVIRIDTI
jgi:outer membrane protein OmpA-like peptidoglycan-associated protein